MAKEQLKQFTVRRSKIRDDRGKYCHPGETAHLTKAHAKHYHNLGLLSINMDKLFDDDSNETDNTGSGSGGGSAEPDGGSVSADETAAGAKAPATAIEDTRQASSRRRSNTN